MQIRTTANRLGDHRARHGLLACAALSACMALACSTIPGPAPVPGPGPAPAAAAHPEGPGEGASPGLLAPGLLADLARIVGRQTVDRGDALLRMFRERGFDPHVQEFRNPPTDREPRGIGRNLIVTVGEGRRDIVVGAHYDVFRLREGGVTGVAVDNCAAAVVLTRVAETLRRHELDHRVQVVLFDLEEIGLRGSNAYVQDQDGDRIAAMVNVDVVAADGTLMYGPTDHDGNEAVYRSLRVVCANSGISCMSFPRYPSSDDRTFQAAVLPGLTCLVLGYWFLVTAIPRGRRVRTVVPTLVGVALGGPLWVLWLGPLLLP